MRARKWGFPVIRAWHANEPAPAAGPAREPAPEPESTPPPATETPAAAESEEVDARRVWHTDRQAADHAREVPRATPAPLDFGSPLRHDFEAPERQWPDPRPDEHLALTPHCNGRHGPGDPDDFKGRCEWCEALTELASDMRETRRRVSELEENVAALNKVIAARRSRS
ncbi:hypothetical protein [Actinomadura nitritigenes]|uniref:hypothetical protein n=1 Tax=Actinomadura nitritigenes TaxID=134602 RepID=UPI003D8DC441